MQLTYVIGDVHGHAEAFAQLLKQIQADMAQQPQGTQFRLVQIGDLIDRGPASCTVIEMCQALPTMFPMAEVHVLCGNHEMHFVDIYNGSTDGIASWLPLEHGKGGGITTLQSYGCVDVLDIQNPNGVLAAIRSHVPQAHIDYLTNLPYKLEDDTYLFVHGGVLPGIPFDQHTPADFMALYGTRREAFMQCEDNHGKIIVHGHTPRPEGEILSNRVNTDAGAGYNLHLQCVILPEVYDMAKVRKLQVAIQAPVNWIDHHTYKEVSL